MLAAVTVGGGVLGIGGMLLAVPITATIYQMLRSDVIRRTKPQPASSVPEVPEEISSEE